MKTGFILLRRMGCVLLPGLLFAHCSQPAKKAVAAHHIIEIKEMRFQPAALSVHAGDTVEWINQDFVEHDVTELSGKEWHSSALATGKSWSFVVVKTADYYCSIHQVMKGKLLVE